MLYILPIIYFLMVYGAMYHVPKYNPELPATENTVKEVPLPPPPVKKDVPQEIPVIPPVPAATEPQTLPAQTPPSSTESATKENAVNGTSLPTPDNKVVNPETPSEPMAVPSVAITPPASTEPQTLPEQTPSLNPESVTSENTVNGASLPTPDNKVVNPETPSEPMAVPSVAIMPPTSTEPQTLPDQTPSLNPESVTSENAVNGASLPTPDNKVVNPETPSEPMAVPSVAIMPPTSTEPQTLPDQTPPLSMENASQVAPAQSESLVPQQKNELSAPSSPEQEPAPIRLEDLP